MKEMKLAEIMLQNNVLGGELSGELQYRLAILSNIMVPQVKEIMELMLRREGINVVVEFGDYDNIVQDSAKFSSCNANVIFWELANLIDGLQYKADLIEKEEVEAIIKKVIGEIDLTFSNLSETSLVLLNRFSTLLFNSTKIRRNNFDYIAERLNAYIEQINAPNVVVVDIDKIIADVSLSDCVDWRFFYSSKSLYTVNFFKAYAKFVRPVFMSACGRAKKVLVFDCDNTLWKGILGEDGFDGINMSASSPEGIVYEEVQSIAVKLAKQGVIIGLCSKNNASEVDEVIRSHPDMILTDQYITQKKVNWHDKLENLKSIAKELNVGIDSLVFVDDSDFEVNLVRYKLPQVSTFQVPKKSGFYPHLIRENANLFFSLSSTPEDIQKSVMYRENAMRLDASADFDNIEEYLRSLGQKVTIFEDSERLASRVAQLTQKTNQFNLTTKRYTGSEIKAFMASEKRMVIAFSVEDRFGESGVVGGVIIQTDNALAEIDSFLMSCRVIGRGIEYAIADWIVSRLADMGIKEVKAMYRRTLKNEQVSTFYDLLGYENLNNDSGEKSYMLKIEEYLASRLDYVEVNKWTKE